MYVLNEKTFCCFHYQGGFTPFLGSGIFIPKRGLQHGCVRVVLFLCNEAVESLDS